MFRKGGAFPGAVIVKVGVLDDASWHDQNVPKGELFAPERVKWASALDGAAQVPAMP